jgi:dTDP-4-dehydrorhamnose 3,5-epimerase
MCGKEIFPLTVHRDERGCLFEVFRKDSLFFEGFGQVYCTFTNQGVTRGFHRHFTHSDVICCLSGEIQVVTIEQGVISETILSSRNPEVMKISPLVWHGWKGLSDIPSIVVSLVKKTFDPNDPDVEIEDAINNRWGYEWSIKR